MTNHSQYAGPAKSLPSIAEATSATKSLNTCSKYLAITGLDDVLRGEGPFTLFAPTDDAFRDLPAELLHEIEVDPAKMRDVLAYHILEVGREIAEMGNVKLKTLQGTLLTAVVTDDGLNLDHASTCGRAMRCANGVIHSIDKVLMPGFKPTLSAKAREDSAWTGRPPVSRPAVAKGDSNWPFIEPATPQHKSDSA
jgi:uncharacterized surface protein with fasciclin (FAS1) repeats